MIGEYNTDEIDVNEKTIELLYGFEKSRKLRFVVYKIK